MNDFTVTPALSSFVLLASRVETYFSMPPTPRQHVYMRVRLIQASQVCMFRSTVPWGFPRASQSFDSTIADSRFSLAS